ncbi:hypothetical protein DL95DRAFT_395057 [Leptodontidium sp. 2 PMI_412]|nr:hypothetical protein DL95DRAFT_395057 [Leptodontidium sp. 2 PMI_412]
MKPVNGILGGILFCLVVSAGRCFCSKFVGTTVGQRVMDGRAPSREAGECHRGIRMPCVPGWNHPCKVFPDEMKYPTTVTVLQHLGSA